MAWPNRLPAKQPGEFRQFPRHPRASRIVAQAAATKWMEAIATKSACIIFMFSTPIFFVLDAAVTSPRRNRTTRREQVTHDGDPLSAGRAPRHSESSRLSTEVVFARWQAGLRHLRSCLYRTADRYSTQPPGALFSFLSDPRLPVKYQSLVPLRSFSGALSRGPRSSPSRILFLGRPKNHVRKIDWFFTGQTGSGAKCQKLDWQREVEARRPPP